ncbi:serine/threonine protein kinase [Bryobacterales bacterium F-183]|nr:serine/threonine protein kinase [Bryobacterales bacterium F-183]
MTPSTGKLRPGDQAGPFTIVEVLDERGAGVVYRAKDAELDREVALKFLLPHLAEDSAANQRIQAEARIASAIRHPNVCKVFSAADYGGRFGIAMELLEGEHLNRRLIRGRFSISELLTAGAGMAEGLRAVHAAGIVHRALRPASLFLTTGGVAKILDFAWPQEPDESGFAAAYRSPEQAAGQAVDVRSDLFSLGVVLYEMATGRLPFTGESPADVLRSIHEDAPVPPRDLVPELPPDLEAVILRALEKDPAMRYQTAADLSADLKRIERTQTAEYGLAAREASVRRHHRVAMGVVVLAMIAGGIVWFWSRMTSGSAGNEGIRSLAVLPLQPLDPKDQYLGAGIADGVTSRLTSLRQLRLAASSLARRYGNPGVDPVSAGKEMRTDAVLDGTVQREGGRVRVRVQLIRVATGRILWTSQFDETFNSIFSIEDSISRRVATTLALQLSEGGAKLLGRHTTENAEAYDLFRQGQFHWNKFNAEGAQQALKLFRAAIDKDPNYAEAYAGLSWAHTLLAYVDAAPPHEFMPEAKRLAEKSLQLDPALALGHVALGSVTLLYEWNFPKAEAELRRAIDLNSNSSEAHYVLAACIGAQGRLDEGIEEMRTALAMDPVSALYMEALGVRYLYARRFAEARDTLQRTLSLDPSFDSAVTDLALLAVIEKNGDEALRRYVQAANLAGRSAYADQLREAYQKNGIQGLVQKRLDLFIAQKNATALDFASYYALLGKRDEALQNLDQAVTERRSRVIFARNSPVYDNLRADPRFARILDRVRAK